MNNTPTPAVTAINAGAFLAAVPELLGIYAAAMGYDPTAATARGSLWREHAQRSGFRCVIAIDIRQFGPQSVGLESTARYDDPSAIVGFGYGYTGASGQWWHDEVLRGLGGRRAALADYFELTELHVRPGWQGAGIGEELLRALLDPVASAAVLLSTPEGDSRAWRLYRRLGFGDVLRNFLFRGDNRPFAVLGRSLPL